jgi:hypothetical protein
MRHGRRSLQRRLAQRLATTQWRKPHGFRYRWLQSIRLVQVCGDFGGSAELQPAPGALEIFAARAKAPRYPERSPNFGCRCHVGKHPD